jgi:hypothetical protein
LPPWSEQLCPTIFSLPWSSASPQPRSSGVSYPRTDTSEMIGQKYTFSPLSWFSQVFWHNDEIWLTQ